MSFDRMAYMRKCRQYNWLFAGFVGLAVTMASFFISSNVSVPARVIETSSFTSYEKEELSLSFTIRMNRKCDAMVTWWILDKDEHTVILSDTQPGKPIKIGIHDFKSTRKIPGGLKPGDYVYKAVIFDLCENNKLYTSATKVPFSVK
jgi:hypothetical protein